MIKKTFGLAKEGEKIYRVSINASKILEHSDGSIIKDLTIEKIESLGDFYSFMFTLSDGSHIRVNRNNEVAIIERTPDDKLKHPMAVFEDYFSQNRRAMLMAASRRLNDNFERMDSLSKETKIISTNCVISKSIVDSLYPMFPDKENEENVLTEVEFAEMAL